MSVYGLLVDLSWERKIEGNVPLLAALVAGTPAADAVAKTQVWEVGIAETDADAFRVRIGRLVGITADSRDGGLRAAPSDIVTEGKREDLGRLVPQLPAGPPRTEDGPRLCALRSDGIRGQRYELERGEPVRMTYESRDMTGPVYAERVFAAYDLRPWLRAEAPDFRTLFQAETCLVVLKYVRRRPCLIGVLPNWR